MKIEKVEVGVYRISETLGSRRLLMKASEIVELYDWARLHFRELEAETMESEDEAKYHAAQYNGDDDE